MGIHKSGPFFQMLMQIHILKETLNKEAVIYIRLLFASHSLDGFFTCLFESCGWSTLTFEKQLHSSSNRGPEDRIDC